MEQTGNKLIKLVFSINPNTLQLPDVTKEIPEYPYSFDFPFLKDVIYPLTLNGSFPMTVALVYFTSVHLINRYVQNCQIAKFKELNKGQPLPSNLKKLPAVPFKVSTWKSFKLFVIIHNILLCVYSVWTFIGMTSTIAHLSFNSVPSIFESVKDHSFPELFWQSICNNDQFPLWPNQSTASLKGLTYWGYLFYLSKYYEILDTVIILLKGRPSSLLQSYHHSGAILCMWSGVRFMSPPIWIFVVFNSFIHSIMYGYFTLSCLKIRLPMWFKQSLTTLQITQFLVGGSLAISHLFVHYFDNLTGTYNACISTSEQAIAVYINVLYLAPLTMLFGAFYIDSYRKRNSTVSKSKTQ